MLPFGVVLIEGINNDLQVFLVAQEIGIGHIDKDGLQIVLPDVMGIGFLYAEEVFVGYSLLVGAVSLFDVLLQFADGRVKVDQDIRLDQLLVDDLKQPLIQPELIFGQIDLGKKEALRKQVIGNGKVLEKVFLLDQFF